MVPIDTIYLRLQRLSALTKCRLIEINDDCLRASHYRHKRGLSKCQRVYLVYGGR